VYRGYCGIGILLKMPYRVNTTTYGTYGDTMIKIVIASAVLVRNISQELEEKIKADLIFKNNKYEQAMKRRKQAKAHYTINIDPYVYFYKRKGSALVVPRGYMNTLLHYCKGKEVKIIDKTVQPKADISFIGKLRQYQEKGTKATLKSRYGILEAATGAGKTVMGTYITTKKKTKTLIIVHNKELLYQWVEAFSTFTNLSKEDIGIIGDGKYDVKDVTIGIINSVSKKCNNLRDSFGFVIYDECHRTLGNTWVQVINSLKPHSHLGLSATPYRSDGLTKALFRVVGPKLHKVQRKLLEDTGAVLIPEVYSIPTRFRYSTNKARSEYSKMMSELTNDELRNVLITKQIFADFKKYGEPIMVVSDRVSHCKELGEELNTYVKLNPVVLHSGMSKKKDGDAFVDRKQAVKDLKAGKYNVLIATVSLLGEGFDAPNLSAIFLTTPMRFSGRLLQTIGRILRPSGDNMPRVYDFKDNLEEVLRYSGFARDKIYKAHNWKIK
jgi:superfamily II DNA or RNA helicase